MSYDARITPLRDGIAGQSIEGLIKAKTYVEAKPRTCAVPAAALRRAPDPASEQLDQLLFGEVFDVLEARDGFVWGQARRDGYVGYVAEGDLTVPTIEPTHWVSALRTYAFAENSIKSAARGPYCLGALVTVEAQDGRLSQVARAGWMTTAHLTPIGVVETDLAGIAERYLGAPYLWGGRESLGLDCSGLVQQAMFACGLACPRDTDQQQALGRPIDPADFGRGDLVFWKGHVAMGLDAQRIVHANAFHMMVAIEPLEAAITRIGATTTGQPTAYRRL